MVPQMDRSVGLPLSGAAEAKVYLPTLGNRPGPWPPLVADNTQNPCHISTQMEMGDNAYPVLTGNRGSPQDKPVIPVLPSPPPCISLQKKPTPSRTDPEADLLSQSQDTHDAIRTKHSYVKYEIRDCPGLGCFPFAHLQAVKLIYEEEHLAWVPVFLYMSFKDDTAHVVSTVLCVAGTTTLMHTFFGSRLPLIQGSSFVYLAPALAIINSPELLSISENRFRKTMRELQGAVLIASAFQFFLGYSGLMSVFIRFINPVVVTPTVAVVGLAFFSYGFPMVGACVEIGIPQIMLIFCFALYLRRISISGHRIFQVFAVPLGIGITWAYAFLLTETGSYNFKGCDMHVLTSNILSESCRRHAFTMMNCRTDASSALKTAPWLRFPYPLQWGVPTFHWKSAGVMIVASIVATVDSVGTYHASSLLVASRVPTPGVVSRAIGLEGLTSALAGLWGIGTGANTLTENVHTIAVTKIGSRRVVELGACTLILMSVVGKIGAFIASIPTVMVAALLCVIWTMTSALGLSNLRYSETGSSRNMLIMGLSLFLSLSIPAYFQHYGVAMVASTVPTYFQPYAVAAHGPIRTGIISLDYFLNTVLSMHMVISFVVAFVLDNTVPGSRQERGTYIWSKAQTVRNEPSALKDYGLPQSLAKIFSWASWVGL